MSIVRHKIILVHLISIFGSFLIGVVFWSLLANYFVGKPYSSGGLVKLFSLGVILITVSCLLDQKNRKQRFMGVVRAILKITCALLSVYAGFTLILNFTSLMWSYSIYLAVISFISWLIYYLVHRKEKRMGTPRGADVKNAQANH